MGRTVLYRGSDHGRTIIHHKRIALIPRMYSLNKFSQCDEKNNPYPRWKEFPTFAYRGHEVTPKRDLSSQLKTDILQYTKEDTCMSDRNHHKSMSKTGIYTVQESLICKNSCGMSRLSSSLMLIECSDSSSESHKEMLSESREPKIQRYKRYYKQSHAKRAQRCILQEMLQTEFNYMRSLWKLRLYIFEPLILSLERQGDHILNKTLNKIKNLNEMSRFITSFAGIFQIHWSFCKKLLSHISAPCQIHTGNDTLEHVNMVIKGIALKSPRPTKTIWKYVKSLTGIHNHRDYKCGMNGAERSDLLNEQAEPFFSWFTSSTENEWDSHMHHIVSNLMLTMTEFLEIFSAQLIQFPIYSDYCTFYSIFVSEYSHMAQNSNSKCKKRLNIISEVGPISSNLIKPVQRLCQYGLLLQQARKYQDSLACERVLEEILVNLNKCISEIEHTKLKQERIDKTALLESSMRKSFIKKEHIMILSSMVLFGASHGVDAGDHLQTCVAVLFDDSIQIVRSKNPSNESPSRPESSTCPLKSVKLLRLSDYLLIPTVYKNNKPSLEKTVQQKPRHNILLRRKNNVKKEYKLEFLLPSEYTQWMDALKTTELIPSLTNDTPTPEIESLCYATVSAWTSGADDGIESYNEQYLNTVKTHPRLCSLLLKAAVNSGSYPSSCRAIHLA